VTAAYDKSGQPLNAEAWGKSAYEAFIKAGKVKATSKDPKEIADAQAEVVRLQTGQAKALADEAKAEAAGGAPAQPSTILGKMFGQ
jgi:hypothetical protein